MIRLARLSIRRPRAALAFWAIFAVVLSLHRPRRERQPLAVDLRRPGQRVLARPDAVASPSSARPCSCRSCLEGPPPQLDRQGPKLVVALGKRDDTRVMSAWSTRRVRAGAAPAP